MINAIIINGSPRSGKDTFVRFVREYCDGCECAHVVNHSTVDTLKNMLINLGWDGNKTDIARCVLANLKQFWVDECNNGPTREVVDRIMELMVDNNGEDVLFFIHCREPLEINKIKSILDSLSIAYPISVSTLIVRRQEAEKEAFTNDADKHTDEYSYDFVINNDGTWRQLKEMAEGFCNTILKFGGHNE